MELIKPDIGLLFWMIFSFSIVLFVLIKFAWKPILKAIKAREKSIAKSLNAAQRAKDEMAKIEFGNEKITALAKVERENILKEAKEEKSRIIEEAKESAKIEAQKILEEARKGVLKEKEEAIHEIKNQIAELSVGIAEKLLREHLSDDSKQKQLISQIVKNIELN
ncbi:MAG: F0F1 ATP synthase subunit B [Bacteroidales bacterium]|jgi:F-type H+-transporting ATPase subunit b|nr:F0F1 ATP synthase subunit B [Bacteroidales bacterium]